MAPIRTEIDAEGARLRITLSGAALCHSDALAMQSALARAQEDPAIRVVSVVGGADFCPGRAEDLRPTSLQPDPARLLGELQVPVVAAVRGATRSVGLELLLAADIRIGSADSTFGLPEVAEGELPCWGGTQRLPRAVGRSLATQMLLLGTSIDSGQARRSGLLCEVAEGPEERMEEIIALLLGGAPLAQAYAKTAVLTGSELRMRDGMQLEADLNAYLRSSADRREGLDAFFAGRPADFTGR